LKGSNDMHAKKPPAAAPSAGLLANFIEMIIDEADARIKLVDRDLVTDEVIVLFNDGSRFTITVAQSD